MISVLGLLTGSAIGRKLALYGMIAFGVLLVVWRIFAAGKAAERAKQSQAALKALRTRVTVDDQISKLSAPERRDALRKWVRD